MKSFQVVRHHGQETQFFPNLIYFIAQLLIISYMHFYRMNLLTVKEMCQLFQVTVCVQLLSFVQLFATPRTVARQAPLFMGYSSKNTGVGSHSFLLRNLPDPGIEPHSPVLQEDSLLSEPPWKLLFQATSNY